MSEPSSPVNGQNRVVEGLVTTGGVAGYKQGANGAAVTGSAYVALETVVTGPSGAALGTAALQGALTETAPGTDTASSGLNGRLQRIAQRLTSLIALLPAALGAGGGLKVDGSGTALPVDTELPAAVALANGDAIPTAPTIGAVMRQPYASAPTTLYAPQVYSVGGALGGSNHALLTQGPTYLSNNEGSSDVARGNTNPSTGMLASAARTATATTAEQDLTSGRGVVCFLNVTANPGGAETLSLAIQARDKQSGVYTDLADAGVVLTAANGARILVACPGVVQADHAGAGTVVWAKSVHVPKYWRAVVTHSGAGSWTYSLSQGDLL